MPTLINACWLLNIRFMEFESAKGQISRCFNLYELLKPVRSQIIGFVELTLSRFTWHSN